MRTDILCGGLLVNRRVVSGGIICVLLSVSLIASAQAQPTAASRPTSPTAPLGAAGTAFRYQGQLKNGNVPVNDTCDIVFSLYDAASNGVQIGNSLTQIVVIVNGLFTTELDFGAMFNGNERWLDMQVRCPAGGGAYTQLSPRQALTPVPYSLYSTAPWVTSGSNVNYPSGNVGIGTSTPAHHLSIAGGPL